MIADFGLSRVMDEDKFHLLTEICGTPGVRPSKFELPSALASDRIFPQYMAPEIFKKSELRGMYVASAAKVLTAVLLRSRPRQAR